MQTLWGQFARKSLDVPASDRAARMAWASGVVQHQVESFNSLSADEAKLLITTLQSSLGLAASPAKRIRSRERAKAAGTEGRRGSSKSATLVSANELEMIKRKLQELGWTQETFERWLHSPSSPLAKSASKQIRTVGDANRVYWALKHIVAQRNRTRRKAV